MDYIESYPEKDGVYVGFNLVGKSKSKLNLSKISEVKIMEKYILEKGTDYFKSVPFFSV